MRRTGHAALVAFAALACVPAAHAAGTYRTAGICAGFPRTTLASPPGTCVGLVASGLAAPRGVASVGSDIYVVETGTAPGQGLVLRFGHDGHDAPQTVLSGLDWPTVLGPGPGGALDLAVRGGIDRLDLRGATPHLVPVLDGLPDDHHQPLTAFAFAPDGTLYVNVGTAGAACSGAARRPPCASIIVVHPAPGQVANAADARVLATGLRNSEGLAVLPDGKLAATVNVRDFLAPGTSSEDVPHDLLDVVTPGADYGWPDCYDRNLASPDHPGADCARRHAPTFLLPGHASPLAVLLYRGDAIPALSQTLLIPFHGFRSHGHRLMAMKLTPSGGLTGTLVPVIADWDADPGSHPRGAPTSLAETPDGAVLITEDHNGTLLILARQ